MKHSSKLKAAVARSTRRDRSASVGAQCFVEESVEDGHHAFGSGDVIPHCPWFAT